MRIKIISTSEQNLSTGESNSCGELERKRHERDMKNGEENSNKEPSSLDILKDIRKLGAQKKIPISSNIFQHYNDLRSKKKISQDMFQMVTVVLAAPATQVSVERSFSALHCCSSIQDLI